MHIQQICLDNQRPSQKEVDTVAILLAIQKSRNIKEHKRKYHSKKVSMRRIYAITSHGEEQ